MIRVAIGLSGGPDSVALLHYLLNYVRENELGVEITALHYNHNWNPILDDADQKLCEDICRVAGIEVIIAKNETGLTSETDSRNLRYEFFKTNCMELNAKILFLGHHQDDNIETILFRLLRGTGSAGLCGIPRQRELFSGCDISRPLLGYSKSEIYEYCEVHGISFHEDPTNYEVKAKRNQIRHNIVPVLESYEPNFRKYISRMASNVASDAQVLKIWAEQRLELVVINQTDSEWSIYLPQWNNLEECEQIFLWRMLDNTSADRHRYEVVKESMINRTKRNLKGGWIIDYPDCDTLRMKRVV